jgi:hypothetical protein
MTGKRAAHAALPVGSDIAEGRSDFVKSEELRRHLSLVSPQEFPSDFV